MTERDALRRLIACVEVMITVRDKAPLVWLDARNWLGVALQEYKAAPSEAEPAPEPDLKRRKIHTDRVQSVLMIAEAEARDMGHEFVGTHHLLLGVLREGQGIGCAALAQLGFDGERLCDAVREQVRRLTNKADEGEEIEGVGVVPYPNEPAPEPVAPLCPSCKTPLHRVTYPGGCLNPDQWDSVRAGDWYCDQPKCAAASDAMYRYFWNADLIDTEQPRAPEEVIENEGGAVHTKEPSNIAALADPTSVEALAAKLRTLIVDCTHWEEAVHPKDWTDRYWQSIASRLARAPEGSPPVGEAIPFTNGAEAKALLWANKASAPPVGDTTAEALVLDALFTAFGTTTVRDAAQQIVYDHSDVTPDDAFAFALAVLHSAPPVGDAASATLFRELDRRYAKAVSVATKDGDEEPHLIGLYVVFLRGYDQGVKRVGDAALRVTDEMVRAALAVEYPEEAGVKLAEDVGFGAMRLCLEAALAAQPTQQKADEYKGIAARAAGDSEEP